MDAYFQALAAVLLGVVMILTLKNRNSELSIVLCVAICVMVSILAIQILSPVISFLQTLRQIGSVDNGVMTALLKIVGIGLLSELGSHICEDAGVSALGRSLQFVGTGVILWLSLPLLNSLLSLLQDILGAV